jgi:hypothetical protein
MRLGPLLLHALLSLALMANGINAAMALGHAACAHAAVATAVAAAEPPCHEDTHAGGAKTDAPMSDHGTQRGWLQDDSMHSHAMHESDASQQPPSGQDRDDCDGCAQDCRCECIAHGLTALMPATLQLHSASDMAYAIAMSTTHSAPALPHPVRPPIG